MANYKKYDLYMATNHSTGEVREYIASSDYADEMGFDLVDDPLGWDTDIDVLEKGGWILVFGETLSGCYITSYIRPEDLDTFKRGMKTLHIE